MGRNTHDLIITKSRKDDRHVCTDSLLHKNIRCKKDDDGYIKYTKQLAGYLLTPWRRVLLEKVTGSAASQEIPRI